jgi:diadenosine tetraphosphatase ApaH/serine/threonine PP2A family protein phosphatase
MLDDGFASRLDVDDQGNVVTIMGGTIIDHGEKVLTVDGGQPTYDGDVMPILDAYVKEHPEFSWQGAKGIVAITGYAGAFGYRITDLHLFDEQTQQWMLDKTKAVAQALRNSGWQIACHSYTHNQYWNKKTITMEEEQYDIGRWLGEIAPYVGDTNIFISPFGVSFDGDDPRFRYLVDHGFNIYCPVDSYQPCYVRDDYMIQGRINLDGLTMKRYPERISKHFFDPTPILDPARPE